MPTHAISDLELYGFADPASGKSRLKKQRARQAIIIIAADYLLRIFVIYSWAGRLPTTEFRDKIVDLYGKFNPKLFGIESNAMQELFGDLVIEKAREKYGHCRIIGIPSPTKIEKDFKIRTTLEPLQCMGQLFIPLDAIELRSEYSGFPTNILKDMIDCLSMAVSLIPRRTPQQEQSTELSDYAAYLRNSGVSPALIADQVEKARLEMYTKQQRQTETLQWDI